MLGSTREEGQAVLLRHVATVATLVVNLAATTVWVSRKEKPADSSQWLAMLSICNFLCLELINV